MRDRSLSILAADLTDDNKLIDDDAMGLVVNAHIEREWTDNEPFDFAASLKVGFFCAQLANDSCDDDDICGIGAVFLDAGISTTAMLAAASFTKAVRHLSPKRDRYPTFLCVATTDETSSYQMVSSSNSLVVK
jgi:hypothetical protein